MRHLNLIACVVLLVSSACVDLARPRAIADAGDGGVADAHVDAPDDAPAEAAPDGMGPDAPDGGGPEAGDAGDGGGADAMNLHTGLIGYWKLDSETGGMAVDSSGLGNDGTIAGLPSLTATPPAPLPFSDLASFTFSRTDDAVVIPDAPSLSPSELTVALWVRFATANAHDLCGGIPGTLQYLFHRRTPRVNGSIEGVALVRTQDGRFGFILGNSQGLPTEIDDLPSGMAAVSTGVWYHVVGTFAATHQVRLYVNGVLTPNGAGVRPTPVEFGTRPVYLGRSGECMLTGSGDTNWDAELSGALDDVRFYNRALSAAEVQMLYQGSDF